jgi:hypothetical protein
MRTFDTVTSALLAFADAAGACQDAAIVPHIIRQHIADVTDWGDWVAEINTLADARASADWGGAPHIRPAELRIERGTAGEWDERPAVILTYGAGRTEARMRIIVQDGVCAVWARINPDTVDWITPADLASIFASLTKRVDAIDRRALPIVPAGTPHEVYRRVRTEGAE